MTRESTQQASIRQHQPSQQQPILPRLPEKRGASPFISLTEELGHHFAAVDDPNRPVDLPRQLAAPFEIVLVREPAGNRLSPSCVVATERQRPTILCKVDRRRAVLANITRCRDKLTRDLAPRQSTGRPRPQSPVRRERPAQGRSG